MIGQITYNSTPALLTDGFAAGLTTFFEVLIAADIVSETLANWTVLWRLPI
jgi:hypothetical protein